MLRSLVGSEMCIRDRCGSGAQRRGGNGAQGAAARPCCTLRLTPTVHTPRAGTQCALPKRRYSSFQVLVRCVSVHTPAVQVSWYSFERGKFTYRIPTRTEIHVPLMSADLCVFWCYQCALAPLFSTSCAFSARAETANTARFASSGKSSLLISAVS